MTVAIIVVVCLVLLVLGFLLPRLSRFPQRGVDRTLETGQRGAGKAPGWLGRLLQKPFQSAERSVDKSASAGRRGRSKTPL